MADPTNPNPADGPFPNSLGTVHWFGLEREGQPKVCLAQGTLNRAQAPTWGLAVEGEEPQQWPDRPREVTEGSLRAWLESATDPEAARILAASAARAYPDLFAGTP